MWQGSSRSVLCRFLKITTETLLLEDTTNTLQNIEFEAGGLLALMGLSLAIAAFIFQYAATPMNLLEHYKGEKANKNERLRKTLSYFYAIDLIMALFLPILLLSILIFVGMLAVRIGLWQDQYPFNGLRWLSTGIVGVYVLIGTNVIRNVVTRCQNWENKDMWINGSSVFLGFATLVFLVVCWLQEFCSVVEPIRVEVILIGIICMEVLLFFGLLLPLVLYLPLTTLIEYWELDSPGRSSEEEGDK